MALLATLSIAMVALAGPGPLDARQTRLIDLALHPYAQPDAPGAVVGVVRGGKFLYRKGVGMADLERNVKLTPEHVFFVASVSKQFTATCVLLLEEQGKLKLSDPVRKYVPELPHYDPEPTIQHLLNHSSGIRDYYSLNELKGIDIESYYTDADILSLICRQKELNFKPGDQYSYSNSGYFLLKTIVERVSKQSIQQFSHEQIFEPLGMSHTRYQDGVGMLVPGRALAYGGSIEGGFANAHNSDAVVGTRGLLTTIDDFQKWFDNFKHNKLGKGKQELIARLTTPQKFNDGTPMTYACGLIVRDIRGVKRIAHTGFFAGYRTRVNYYPDSDTMSFVFCNSYAIDPDALSDKIEAIVLADQFEKPKPPEKPREAKPVPVEPASLLPLVGLYLDAESNALLEVTLGEAGLVLVDDAAVQKRLVAEGADRFYEPTKGEEVAIVSRNGRPVGFTVKPPEGKARTFERQVRVTYDAKALEKFAGTYESEEVGAEHQIVMEDGALVLKVYDDKHTLKALPNGDFTCPLGRVSFAPDASSYVVYGGRVKRMPFQRKRDP
ncbi:MAG: serine hydrolase [Fimbriimonadaceae bacterium]|nr:serine hydrolase [Chthonomonadaceae bacterium]MCO5297296.1 serine hydrolase [Fimbriimonadaceae bacterium]